MIHKDRLVGPFEDLLQYWLDELIQMIDLLKFSSSILIEFAVSRKNMEFLKQLEGLGWLDFWNDLHLMILTESLPALQIDDRIYGVDRVCRGFSLSFGMPWHPSALRGQVLEAC